MVVNENRTKRDPRVKRTDKLLKQTFQELLGEKDFRSITVQDIVDRAAINRATFYEPGGVGPPPAPPCFDAGPRDLSQAPFPRSPQAARARHRPSVEVLRESRSEEAQVWFHP